MIKDVSQEVLFDTSNPIYLITVDIARDNHWTTYAIPVQRGMSVKVKPRKQQQPFAVVKNNDCGYVVGAIS